MNDAPDRPSAVDLPTCRTGDRLPMLHLLLAILVVAVWGTNFVVIHHGLEHFRRSCLPHYGSWWRPCPRL